MKFNYHTHTTRCQHAQGTERAYVEAAIRGGFQVLGFSDHVPYPFADGHRSGMRMGLSEIRGYFDSLLALREEYKDRIRIHIGFEAEYDPNSFGRLKTLLSDYPCEYLIQGQHFLNVEKERDYAGRPNGSEDLLRRYADLLMEGMESGHFLYTAHPDLPDFCGSETVYDKIMRPVCRTARKCGSPLEINILGLVGGRPYPHEAFFRIAAEEGCRAVLGVDAHHPDMLSDTESYRKGLEFAERCGIEVLSELMTGGHVS